MRSCLILAAALGLALPAQAQRPDIQNEPSLSVLAPADLAFTFTNATPYESVPLPYLAPADTAVAGGFYDFVGPSLFLWAEVDAVTGDTLGVWDLGIPYTAEGATANLVKAEPALACDPDAQDITAAPLVTNPEALAGRIAFIERGDCYFGTKAIAAWHAGATGVVIWMPESYGVTTSVGMALDDRFIERTDTLTIDIPVILIGNGTGQPLSDALDAGEEVTVSISCADAECVTSPAFRPLLPEPVAAEGGPDASAFGLAVYPNPAAGQATVRLTATEGDAVQVEVFDLLGRSVATLSDGRTQGAAAFELDTSALPVGLYLVRALGETDRATVRLSVVR